MLEDAVEHYAGTLQSLISFYWRFIEYGPQTKRNKKPNQD